MTSSPVRVVAAVIWDGDRMLLTQRPPRGPLGLLWELPGGKIEPGEDPAVALVRELREELGVGAASHEVVATATHDYAHGLRVELTFIRCTLDSHALKPSEAVNAFRWLRPSEIEVRTVLEADRAFLVSLGAKG
jgi:mutator protein MutT